MAAQFLAHLLHTGAIGLAVSYTIASILTGFYCRDPHISTLFAARMATRVDSRIICRTLGNGVALYKVVSIPIRDAIVHRSVYNDDLTFGPLGPTDLAVQFILMRYGLVVLMTGMGFWSAAFAIIERAQQEKRSSRKAQQIRREIHCQPNAICTVDILQTNIKF